MKNASIAHIEDTGFCSELSQGFVCSRRVSSQYKKTCVDSLEAVIGALYVYARDNGVSQPLMDIWDWFLSFPAVTQAFESELGKRDLYSLSGISLGPEIDMSDKSKLWRKCPPESEIVETRAEKAEKAEKSLMEYARAQAKAQAIAKEKGNISLPFAPEEDLEEYLHELERYYDTKSKWTVTDMGGVLSLTVGPDEIFTGYSMLGDKDEAIRNMYKVFY